MSLLHSNTHGETNPSAYIETPTSFTTEPLPQSERLLRLGNALHTTLDVYTILEFFFDAICKEVEIQHLHYVNAAENLSHLIGQEQRHSLSYQLNIEQMNLGALTITRTKRFAQQEIVTIENILCLLVYPLRNAIQYRQALLSSASDPLTGIANRHALEPTLNSELLLSKRHQKPLSLLLIDIDHFKSINDNYGHNCGDYVLASIAQQITHRIRESDLFYRFGGDEFVLILRETSEEGAMILAERIREDLSQANYTYKRAPIHTSVSIGIATAVESDDPESILERADRALYRAKDAGRDLVSL